MSTREEGSGSGVVATTSSGAKITHVKATTIDAGGGAATGVSVGAVLSGGVSTAAAIKVATGVSVATSLAGGPTTLSAAQVPTATAIRAAAAAVNVNVSVAGQPTQVRVVVPTAGMPSMIKQFEGAASGRTQITAITTATARTVSNTSITGTRPVAQSTYLSRAGITATQMTGVGMATGQRLVTPIRATPTSAGGGVGVGVSVGVGGASTVTGLTTAGSFVRATATNKNSVSSSSTTVISPATSTTWVAANSTGPVQLIRAIPHPSRQRIITTQGVSNATVAAIAAANGGVGAPAAVAVSGTVVSTTSTTGVVVQAQSQAATSQHQAQGATVTSQAAGAQPHSQQPTYVATLATVLPPRQHQATLVYSSNVAALSQPLSQAQQYSHTVAATGQRFAVATQLTSGAGSGTAMPRQIRPIPLGKSFSTAKLNTTSISIRAPNLPQLTPTLGATVATGPTVATISAPRSTTVTAVSGSTANVIPTANLSTTRIIQLQQPGGATQQIIGSAGRIAGNVMPIIVNASSAGKFGFRPPVTMAAKVQPSLTITHLGIGKLPAGGASGSAQQGVTASLQTIGQSGNASPAIGGTSGASVTASNLSAGATAQLVNVSQGAAGQLLTTQNIVSSAAGGATVVPLAITTRGGAGGSSAGGGSAGGVLTGTITSIKNGSAITVGKVMTAAQAQVVSAGSIEGIAAASGGGCVVTAAGTAASGASVYNIHHAGAVATHRPHNVTGTAATVTVVNSNGTPTSNSVNTVLTSTGAANAGGFIYYESMPASSVQVSTGVLSLTTTTVTSSTMAHHQIANSAANLAITSLPFVTAHAANGTNGNTGGATFTVVPSGSGRTIGQLQLPVSSAGGAQIQAVPVRFSAQLANAAVDAIAVSQASAQLVQATISSTGQQILIPTHQPGVVGGGGGGVPTAATVSLAGQPASQSPMVIPLQTSIKVAPSGTSTGTATVSNYLRKRDADGSPIRAAKNLGPTLLSMGTNIVSAAGSPVGSSIGSSFSIASSGATSLLTVDTYASKDRSAMIRNTRGDSPISSDGSTTVSANSSPGVEQQMFDPNLLINRMQNDTMHFNPINELYANHHSVVMHHNSIGGGCATPGSSRTSSIDHQLQQRMNGSLIEYPTRKKSRRSTDDSQISMHSPTSLIAAPSADVITSCCTDEMVSANDGLLMANYEGNPCIGSNIVINSNNVPPTAGNKENAKPVEYIIRRPRNCTLLNSYKQNWKTVSNHFQRYTDVKPREERRPNIIDLANQPNVLSKINGWKIYHLRSQMEDLCENETSGYEQLSDMLQQMETHENNPEMERICDLVKGNMQRSKIIVDGINEAQNQIMKIFDHKSHVSDIINRCASKRNFKKREKL